MQPTDWDKNGVSVPAGNIILPAISPTSLDAAAILAANLAHSGIVADLNHKVQGSADTHPIFDTAIAAQTYTRGTAITNWSLPDGLVSDAATRTLSGTPTKTQKQRPQSG